MRKAVTNESKFALLDVLLDWIEESSSRVSIRPLACSTEKKSVSLLLLGNLKK